MPISVYYSDTNGPQLHATDPSVSGVGCRLEYLDEGGANFVFTIMPGHEGSSLPEHLTGKLLRLRKDLPHIQTTSQQLSAFNEHIKPLFPATSLIKHEPIGLALGLAGHINAVLGKITRPSHRLKDFVPLDEETGLLVTDMTPKIGEVLLHMKPKWLSQSPNAPSNATRCRTCALRAQRASRGVQTATDAQESCPLEVTTDVIEDRKRAAQKITDDTTIQDYIVHDAQLLLLDLRRRQRELDDNGCLRASNTQNVFDLCKAMTLRDCTLFLKRSGSDMEAKLGDLDLKQPGKLPRWTKIEQVLVEDGWYTNEESSAEWKKEVVCLLSK